MSRVLDNRGQLDNLLFYSQEEQLVTTDSVKDYRGHIQDVDTLISYIECGDSKPPTSSGGDKSASSRRSERPGRREVKGRRSNGGPVGEERRPGRRGAAKPAPAPARSASLQSRPQAGAAVSSDHSSVCGDLAQTRTGTAPAATPAPTTTQLCERDGKSERISGSGGVDDSHSVTTEAVAQDEAEFLVVTRRQRRRPGAVRETAARSGVWRRRPVQPLRSTASISAPHSDAAASDSDSECGVCSTPSEAARAALPSTGPGSSSSSSTVSVTGAASSWADVAKPKSSQSGEGSEASRRGGVSSTDFIDGVGAIFGEGSPVRTWRSDQLVHGSSGHHKACVDGSAMIGGAHPDEFPAIAPSKVITPSSLSAQTVTAVSKTVLQHGQGSGNSVRSATTNASERDAASKPATSGGHSRPASSAVSKRADRTASPSGWGSRSQTRPPVAEGSKLTNGGPPLLAWPALQRAAKRGPAVVIPTDTAAVDRTNAQDIQFGYIDGVEEAAQESDGPGAKTLTSGVDGFCRRFRQQPVDVSQFNWREISVFLSKGRY